MPDTPIAMPAPGWALDEIAGLRAEVKRLREALDRIRYHGTDPPSVPNYPEDEWWRKVSFDCMRTID